MRKRKNKKSGSWSEKTEEFNKMNKKEKKQFLNNDLIERMVRVEQKVSASFNDPVPYNKTKYYKNLTETEKDNFEKYMKNKGKKKTLWILVLLIPAIALLFLRIDTTGRVVGENIGYWNLHFLEIIAMLVFLFILFIMFVSFLRNKIKNRKFQKDFKILDNILSNKRLIRR